jgi:cystathionine gamma-synthase
VSDLPPGAPRKRGPGFDPLPEWAGLATRLVHGTRRPERNAGAVVGPIYQTSTFHFPAAHSESAEGGQVYLYTRLENPTLEGPTETIRQLEGGEAARLFSSGMGAITAAVLSLVRAGDEVVALQDLYGGTIDLLTDLLPRFGVRVRFVTIAEASQPEGHIGPDTRLVWLESPTNPTLSVVDLRRWSEAADRVGALVAVDNTFATPINQTPLALGADLVLHSATKYLAGHSDVLAGAVVGPSALVDRIDAKGYLGASPDPFAAFLLARSLKTLSLRVARQNENGRRVADALARHPAVLHVHYPGWNSPDEEAIAARQMRGRGGMLSLTLRAGPAAVDPFLRRLRFVHVASSLGSVESLASVPAITSHRHLSAAELAARGIDGSMVRLSLGVEEPEDLVRDLTAALDTLATRPAAPL